MTTTMISDLLIPTGIAGTVLSLAGLFWRSRENLYFRVVYDGKLHLTIRFEGRKQTRTR